MNMNRLMLVGIKEEDKAEIFKNLRHPFLLQIYSFQTKAQSIVVKINANQALRLPAPRKMLSESCKRQGKRLGNCKKKFIWYGNTYKTM